jgi:hypothetical protein
MGERTLANAPVMRGSADSITARLSGSAEHHAMLGLFWRARMRRLVGKDPHGRRRRRRSRRRRCRGIHGRGRAGRGRGRGWRRAWRWRKRRHVGRGQHRRRCGARAVRPRRADGELHAEHVPRAVVGVLYVSRADCVGQPRKRCADRPMAIRERRVVAGFELELIVLVAGGDRGRASSAPLRVVHRHVDVVVAV